jgi:hypothetical protein
VIQAPRGLCLTGSINILDKDQLGLIRIRRGHSPGRSGFKYGPRHQRLSGVNYHRVDNGRMRREYYTPVAYIFANFQNSASCLFM